MNAYSLSPPDLLRPFISDEGAPPEGAEQFMVYEKLRHGVNGYLYENISHNAFFFPLPR